MRVTVRRSPPDAYVRSPKPDRPLSIGGLYRDGESESGDEPVVEATYTVKSMVKPKRGRSTVATDNHVGGRIRERRIMVGLTQQRLAEMIGVTCQQAHKYERGINRVSAGRLFEIARALSAPITYFYEGIGEDGSSGLRPPTDESMRTLIKIDNQLSNFHAISECDQACAGLMASVDDKPRYEPSMQSADVSSRPNVLGSWCRQNLISN